MLESAAFRALIIFIRIVFYLLQAAGVVAGTQWTLGRASPPALTDGSSEQVNSTLLVRADH